MRLQPAERRAQQRIVQRFARGLRKLARVLVHFVSSPSAGSVAHIRPALRRRGARAMLLPCALHAPGQMQQATEIAADQRVGAAREASAILSSAMRSEISGYLTLKSPPKPQQVSLSASLARA